MKGFIDTKGSLSVGSSVETVTGVNPGLQVVAIRGGNHPTAAPAKGLGKASVTTEKIVRGESNVLFSFGRESGGFHVSEPIS